MAVFVVNHWDQHRAHGCEAVFADRDDAVAHARRDVGKRSAIKGKLLFGWIQTPNGAVYGRLNEDGSDLASVSAACEGREVEEFEVR